MPKWNDQDFLAKEQYHNAANLNKRLNIHARFSTNPGSWFGWIFDQIDLPPVCRILELGCGPGEFWRQNQERIPAGWEVTLSDFSEGMLAQARQNLEAVFPRFTFQVINAQSIPYSDASFDAVFANHMLYHVPDRPKALAEIRRVLKSEGTLVATTNGEKHVQEMPRLAQRFDPGLVREAWDPTVDFTLENGKSQLAPYFSEIRLLRYPDSLHVTEAAPLADYILSTARLGMQREKRPELLVFLEQELERCGGAIDITKDSGMFIAV